MSRGLARSQPAAPWVIPGCPSSLPDQERDG